jgi:hypothetical protein
MRKLKILDGFEAENANELALDICEFIMQTDGPRSNPTIGLVALKRAIGMLFAFADIKPDDDYFETMQDEAVLAYDHTNEHVIVKQ